MNTKFEKATIEKKANIYFEGKVSSRTVYLQNGERVTLGFMLPGEYEFGTGDKEIMEVIGGAMTVKLPQAEDWETITEGHSFEVPADSKFLVKVDKMADYCCSYLKE
jgi:uncharacterized protein YaiE (UPF0345 family)